MPSLIKATKEISSVAGVRFMQLQDEDGIANSRGTIAELGGREKATYYEKRLFGHLT